jgi:lysophospholipase L1-like esterase
MRSRWLLAIGSLIACALLAEAAVRALEAAGLLAGDDRVFPDVPYHGKTRPVHDRTLLWVLDPTSELVNADGFRDREYSERKPDGVTRISVLGDSVAFGHGVARERGFTEVLESELAREPGRYEVLNFGVIGYNAAQSAAFYRRRARRFDADIVILSYVLNDATSAAAMLEFFGSVDEQRESVSNPGGSHLLSRAQQAWLRLRGVPPRALVPWVAETHTGAATWQAVENALSLIAETARQDGTMPVLAILPLLLELDAHPFAEFHAQLAHAGRRKGFVVIDLHAALRDLDEATIRLTPHDVIHPNEVGHRAIGLALADAIRPLAESRRDPDAAR